MEKFENYFAPNIRYANDVVGSMVALNTGNLGSSPCHSTNSKA